MLQKQPFNSLIKSKFRIMETQKGFGHSSMFAILMFKENTFTICILIPNQLTERWLRLIHGNTAIFFSVLGKVASWIANNQFLKLSKKLRRSLFGSVANNTRLRLCFKCGIRQSPYMSYFSLLVQEIQRRTFYSIFLIHLSVILVNLSTI